MYSPRLCLLFVRRWLFAAGVCSALVTPVLALDPGSDTQDYNRSTPKYTHDGTDYGPFGWNAKYKREFDGTSVIKHVEIKFNFDAGLGYTDEQKLAYAKAAEANIEGAWNGKFNVKNTATGDLYAAKVNVTLEGPFDQTVNVKATKGAGDPPYNMTNWYVDQDTKSYQAHEFGHMIGLFDEYIGGAVDKYPDPTLSADGLMGLGALKVDPVMYARYFQQWADFMNHLDTTGNPFTVVPVPEPATFAVVLGVSALLWVGRRRSPGGSA